MFLVRDLRRGRDVTVLRRDKTNSVARGEVGEVVNARRWVANILEE